MDHRWALWPVHHHQLQQVARAVRPDDQVAGRVLANFLHREGMANCVVNVGLGDAMAKGGR